MTTPRTEAGRTLLALVDNLDQPDITGRSVLVSVEFLRESILAIEAAERRATVEQIRAALEAQGFLDGDLFAILLNAEADR